MPPNRCEPSIEVIVKMGVRPGVGALVGSKVGGRGWCGVNEKRVVKLGGVRLNVNQELNLL